jgi:outer membrane protein assembly factor BamB
VWTAPLTGAALGGIAATNSQVIVPDRDLTGASDIFRCLDAATGEQLWQLEHISPGELDYGNTPRATPLIHDGAVYLLGAFGHLHCVDLLTGAPLWDKDLPLEYGAPLPTWGYTSSPLVADGKLIVNPGAAEAAVVALDPADGSEIWKSPGQPAAYSSFIAGAFGGVRQVVGYDKTSLGGWDLKTGRRLWTLVPPNPDDFNVPTPIDLGGRLLVSTENNGTRLYQFHRDGTIDPQPIAENLDLAPDTSTPVIAAGLLFGCWGDLVCLDARNGLRSLWTGKHRAFRDYASLVATDDRVLVTSVKGELMLAAVEPTGFRLLSRHEAFDGPSEVHAHPAFVGSRIYIRNDDSVRCLELSE